MTARYPYAIKRECHRLRLFRREVRELLALILIVHLQHFHQTTSLRGLERIIFKDQFRRPAETGVRKKKEQHKKWRTTYPRLISKYFHGMLAREKRFAVMVATCPTLAVLRDLVLWEVMGVDPLHSWNLDKRLMRLSWNVRRIILDGEINLARAMWQEPDRYERRLLKPLLRIGSVDALAGLLGLTKELRLMTNGMLEVTADAAMEIFLRLSVFPPFYEVRDKFYQFLCGDFRHPRAGHGVDVEVEDFEIKVQQLRELLNHVGALGLISSSYKHQVQLVHWYRNDGHNADSLKMIGEIVDKVCLRGETVRIDRPHPLYALLRRMRHSKARSGRPIMLPLKRRPWGQFEIGDDLFHEMLISRRH